MKTENTHAHRKIQSVVREYFEGYTGAESARISRAFHPEVKLYSVDSQNAGALDRTELKDWLKNLDDRKQKGDIRKAELEIPMIDISGTAAIAKVVLTFPKFRFTDYLSLLEIEGSWRIIGKVYSLE
jgi:hypothetical protein